jgi:uncharacterized protein with PIN domain
MSGSTTPRFVVDTMLGRLARWLRVIGYDTAYPGAVEDERLLALARDEDRVLVTRDVRLARAAGRQGCLVRAASLDGQLVEIIGALGLAPSQAAWFSRCMACNARLVDEAPEAVRGRVPPRVFAGHDRFMGCPGCGRVYWWGSHADRMQERLSALLAGS